MNSLSQIESAAKAFSEAREEVSAFVADMNEAIAAISRRMTPVLKRRVAKAAERQAALHALLEPVPELFAKPRTVIFHGIKVGFEKGKGSVEIDDADRTVILIRRHFPDQFEALVKVDEKPRKAAIAALSVADAKRIGATVSDAGDQVVIRPVDSEVDKMVDALLKNAVEEEGAST